MAHAMEGWRYRSLSGLSGWFRRAMVVCLLINLFGLGLQGLDLYVGNELQTGQLASQAYLGFTTLMWEMLHVAYRAAQVAGAAMLCWWFAWAVRNTEVMAHGRLRSKWWSWALFWVPGPSFVVPFRGVCELWSVNRFGLRRVKGGYAQRNDPNMRRDLNSKPALVLVWWTCVLAWIALEWSAVIVIDHGALNQVGLPASSGVYLAMAGYVLGALACGLGIEVVRKITSMQREWDERTPKSESIGGGRRDRSQRVSPLRSVPDQAA
ncbi:MAG: DUF4328 domain-containing protein [Planctomycetota bacterium]